jgi:FkbM family methyltransferase
MQSEPAARSFIKSPRQVNTINVIKRYCITALKWARASQPLNYLATSITYWILTLIGRQSELIIRRLHRVGPVRRKLPNGRTLRLWSRGDDWVSNQVFWRGWDGYEPDTAPLFFRLAARARVTLDVGAYVGYYTILAAHANPAGEVYAFEPLPGVFRRLKRHIEMNRLGNAQCVAAAVGDDDGEAEFFHTQVGIPTSSSLSFEFMRSTRELQSQKVKVITLDRFVRDRSLGCVDLVKIDTESTEPQVLRGMIDTLRRDHPTIICEALKDRGSEKLLEEILSPLGYRYYLLTPDGPEPRARIEGHPIWLNYLFTILNPDEVARL